MKSYRELISIPSYRDRFLYLKVEDQLVGQSTFGFKRYLNQNVYQTHKWRNFRDKMIIRDDGCDMSYDGAIIRDRLILHHINPLSVDDILKNPNAIYDPDNVVCVSDITHKAIHYGDYNLIPKDYIPRTKNDTKLW